MHDLLGLEYINTIMCHYLSTEAREAEDFSVLQPVFFLPLISEKNKMFHPLNPLCGKRCVCLCVRAHKGRE